MRVSLHRRREQLSLPPQSARGRSPKVLAFVIALTACTMAFGMSRMTKNELRESAVVANAEASTRAVVDERIRVHLKKLSRGADN